MYDDEKNKNQVKSESEKNKNNDDEKSWAEEAKQELEDFIESQGIYIRQ